jgi:1,2-diacylglycerol 3-beta-galactosyltransferase
MNLQRPKRPKILFLFSDTGGGHRSAAEALIEALNLEFPGQFETEMVDIFRHAPSPLSLAIPSYPMLTQVPTIWEISYSIFDGRRRVIVANSVLGPYVQPSYTKIVDEHPSDVIVSVHPVPNSTFLDILDGRNGARQPYITVVTDLVTTPAFWYDKRSDLIIVPTEAARLRGMKMGMREEQFRVIGLPVAERFCQKDIDRSAIRARLGWPQGVPMVLVVGGGEGMGPIGKNAMAINKANLPVGLAVICGRNKRLKERLENHEWQIPAFIYGFTRDMPDLMAAADVLVTKAGPGTISEAFIAGLPLILYSRLPGQEEGNVTYVVDEGAGVWAPHTHQMVETLRAWLYHPELRLETAANARRLARPTAAREIARIISRAAGIQPQESSPS